MKNRFVVIEGIDGTGKSTIVNYVQKKFQYDVFNMPPQEMRIIKEYIDREVSPLSRFAYYTSCIIHLSDQIKERLKYNNVICHRYYPSLIANQCYFSNMNILEIEKFIDPFRHEILEPDLTIYLYTDIKVCRERLKIRKDKRNGTDLFLMRSEEYFYRINDLYEQQQLRSRNWVKLITTDYSVQEVCLMVEKLLKGE